MSGRARIAALAGLAIAAALISRADGYQVYILALLGLTTIACVGLNVLLGLIGQISLGHAAFYAIGAYAVAILTTKYDWSFWLAWPLAGAFAAAAGILLAIPALRVRGPYLAMVTIAFGFVVEQSAAEWSGLTGGWNGIMGVPKPALFGWPLSDRAATFGILALTAITLFLFMRLSASPWGAAMRAVRDSEVASQSIGFNPVTIRAVAFAVSAAAAGLAGGVFASISDFISPESFPFSQSILFLLAVMVGGTERTLGPLIGAAVVVLLPEALSSLAGYRLLFVGLLLLVVLRVAPMGIVGLFDRFIARETTSRIAQPVRDVAAFLRQPADGPQLTGSGVAISFGGVRAVRDLDFSARPGEITSIIGPNGAGKSTVLNLICGFYRPDAGRIRLGDADIAARPAYRIARAGIARTYQTTQLFDQMSALDNVMVALDGGELSPSRFFLPDNDPERRATAESLLAFVGYGGPLDQTARALPHVDKRLVEIARALATRPRVLALDEPAAGLDAGDKARLGKLLTEIATTGIAVVLVEHDMHLVMSVSSRIIVLDAGARIADGDPAAVRDDPAVRTAYLGEQQDAIAAPARALKSNSSTVLRVSTLSAGYGPIGVLRNVDLTVAEGQVVAVLGANGAGKSTLMRALSGLNRPVKGEILLTGENIAQKSASRIAAQGLILVPEGRQVFSELSVTDNLKLGAYARTTPELAAKVEALFERFPQLKARRHQRAGLLSGGEQQMLAIARGLIARPVVLMLDEPSLGLAPRLVQSLYGLLAELRDEGTTILLVDQMAASALSVADHAYVLQSGSVVRAGAAADLRADPELVRTYLGGHAP